PIQITVGFTYTLKKHGEIKTFKISIKPCSKSMSWNGAADYRLISIVNYTILIYIPVFNITWTHISKLGGIVIHFFLGLKKALSNITKEGTYRRAFPIYSPSGIFNAPHVDDVVFNIRIIQHNPIVHFSYPVAVID